MTQKLYFLIAILCAVAGTATTAQAASKTVTYTITSEQVSGNRYTFTFVRSGNSFNYSTGDKTVTINDITTAKYFRVELDDGLGLQLNLSQAGLTFGTYDGRTGIQVNYGGSQNDNLTLGSSHYYVTHVKMADLSGNALTGTANPWIRTSGQLDKDVDMVTVDDALGAYNAFSATFSGAQIFGQLTVTYGDTPREYAITFNDVEGLSNPNPASYNVTTSAFVITAPSRTGYTLGTVTYTDALHTTATPVNLSQTPMSIQRGEAVERKAITFNASWTAHQYTVHYDANGGEGSMDDQALTYDEGALAANAFTAPTDYVFNGWNTEDDGSGTAYTDQQAAPNVSPDDGATVTLYAQWRPVAGSCGDNARWSYDDNGTLSITGTGGTYDFTSGFRPWEPYKDAITTVSIGDGITYIGNEAFDQCSNLATITGGNGLIDVYPSAFLNTQWLNARKDNNIVNYIGRVAYLCGNGVSGDVTLADGTISITMFAFAGISAITSVTIPASVATIYPFAFYDCHALTTVHVLAATPPTLGDGAFYLQNSSLTRTFNVRSAAYKTAYGWADIYNKVDEYSYNNNFQMRVVSTLALPDGVTASAADATDKVTILGTTYYAEQASVTLSGLGTEHIAGSITYRSRATVSYGTNQTINLDADPSTGQASFTMPAADAIVTAEEYAIAVKYIDADGKEKTCTNFTFIQTGSGQKLGSSANEEAWYAVSGEVSAGGTLTFQDQSAHLILCDDAILTASYLSKGINIEYGLTIYAQSGGTGSIIARNTTNNNYAISVGSRGLTINGGTVSATGKYGIWADGGVTINGGSVTATGSSEGINAPYGNVTINGGTVSATGDYGIIASSGDVTINGGSVTATGSSYDIRGSNNVTFNGGSVSATGSYGISAGSTITLGWTSATDRITASRYSRDPVVKSGQTLYDGTTAYSGTVSASALAGKTLMGVDILLDDDSAQPDGSKNADRIAALAADGKKHNVMLQGRTLYRDGGWNTLCLPFRVLLFNDADNVITNENHVFHGATVMMLNLYMWYDSKGYYYIEEADGRHRSGYVDADGSLHLYFDPVMDVNDFSGDIAAGTPCIVKWGTTGSHPATHIVNPVFQGVTVTSTTPIDWWTTDEGRDAQTGLGNVTFRGTYAPISYAAADHSILFLGENNTLYYPEAGAHIGPFRAYFELGNGLTAGDPASPVRAFNLSFAAGAEETGIVSLSKESGNQGTIPEFLNSLDYYTLDGVRLNGQPTKKGLYIHGGRKVVIK